MPTPFIKSLSLSLGLLLASIAAAAQSTPVPMPNAVPPSQRIQQRGDAQAPYTYVEKMPIYLKGGKDSLQMFISTHVRGSASGSGAYVTFIIDQTGWVRRPALGPFPAESEAATDSEVASAFRSIGRFRPGYQNGKPVDVQMTMRIVKQLK